MSWHNYSLDPLKHTKKNRAFLNSTLYTYIVVMMGIYPSLSEDGVLAVCLRSLDDDDMLDFFLVLVVATPTGVPALLCSSVLIPLIPGSVLMDTVVLESNTESSSIGGSSTTVLRGMLDGGGWNLASFCSSSNMVDRRWQKFLTKGRASTTHAATSIRCWKRKWKEIVKTNVPMN